MSIQLIRVRDSIIVLDGSGRFISEVFWPESDGYMPHSLQEIIRNALESDPAAIDPREVNP